MERAASNLSPAAYNAAVQRNPNYGLLVPAKDSSSSAPSQTATTAPTANSPTEASARSQLNALAEDRGSSTLKLRLGQEGISLTDNSDVGPGLRFESFADKLEYVMGVKAAILLEIRLSMVGKDGWGPGGNNKEEVEKVRAKASPSKSAS